MQTTHTLTPATHVAEPAAAARSAVSWGAVLAGATIAAALSAMLITGGTGLGFLAMSPWQGEGASGTAMAGTTIAWLFAVQIIAYGVAGYVTGRLRTRWTDAAVDEIYFRDTAHGLLVWAVSALVGIVLLSSAAASAVSGAARTGAALVGSGTGAALAVAGQTAADQVDGGALDRFTDTLLRPQDPTQSASGDTVRGEVSRILADSLARGSLADEDRAYLAKRIAQQTGLTEAEAAQRIEQVSTRARQAAEQAEQAVREAADSARKAAAAFSLWAFASLLIGAFAASYAATVGGRARDQ